MAEPVSFRLLTPVEQVTTIASGRGVDKRHLLKDEYGGKNWSKKKGIARVDDFNGYVGRAEVHWFEAHGVGRVDWKIKVRLDR